MYVSTHIHNCVCVCVCQWWAAWLHECVSGQRTPFPNLLFSSSTLKHQMRDTTPARSSPTLPEPSRDQSASPSGVRPSSSSSSSSPLISSSLLTSRFSSFVLHFKCIFLTYSHTQINKHTDSIHVFDTLIDILFKSWMLIGHPTMTFCFDPSPL